MSLSSQTIEQSNDKNTTAPTAGNVLEQLVISSLVEKGYCEFENRSPQIFANRNAIGGKQYLRHLPVGKTIYENPRKSDLFIVNRDLFPNDLIIECKWQQTSGSVDEKYPFLVLNIKKTRIPTIILIDGNGYKPAALRWLKNQVQHDNSLIGVWDIAEFKKNLNAGYFG
jgi:hypothetical protein